MDIISAAEAGDLARVRVLVEQDRACIRSQDMVSDASFFFFLSFSNTFHLRHTLFLPFFVLFCAQRLYVRGSLHLFYSLLIYSICVSCFRHHRYVYSELNFYPPSQNGNLPIHFASQEGRIEVVKFLFECDPSTTTVVNVVSDMYCVSFLLSPL